MAGRKKPSKRQERGTHTLLETLESERRERFLESLQYEGSQNHKKHLRKFKLAPPAKPKPDKNLCDDMKPVVACPEEADRLLKAGIRRGLVSVECKSADFPAVIWSVREDDAIFEARYGGSREGYYHGYPLFPGDANYDMVRVKREALRS